MSRAALERRAERLRADRVAFVWATVVRAERPTSAKPGDAAVVLADGTVEGFVGGACAEGTVRLQSLQALAAAEPTLLRITPEPELDPPTAPGTVSVANPCLSGGTLEIFLEPALPPPLVVVYGDAPIARALLALAEAADFAGRGASAAEPLPPDTAAVVVATHGRDEPALLTGALEAGVPYVGLVASRRRAAAVLAELPAGVEAGRVHSPAGLDLGARTPAEIALAILAEIVATRPGSVPPAAGTGPTGPTGPPEAPPAVVDPVCGMTVATVPATLRVDHAGRTVWFCGPGCRDAFVADPDRYRG